MKYLFKNFCLIMMCALLLCAYPVFAVSAVNDNTYEESFGSMEDEANALANEEESDSEGGESSENNETKEDSETTQDVSDAKEDESLAISQATAPQSEEDGSAASSGDEELFVSNEFKNELEYDSETLDDSDDTSEEPYESGVLEPFVWVNPDYEDIISEDDIPVQNDDMNAISTFASQEYVDSGKCADNLREHMVNRDNSFTLYLSYAATSINSSALYSQITAILNDATSHTGVGNQGDYINKHLLDYVCSIRYSGSSGAYNVQLTFTMEYFTTASQEEKVTSKVNQVLDDILTPCMSDYEKAEAIYDYITKNVSYDYDHLDDTTYYLQYSTYAALINGTSVCQGYANLFYRMALDAGLDARIITGTSYGQAHAWNIVKVGNNYYNLDATWDSNTNSRTWFLKGSDFANHTRSSAYSAASFTILYSVPSSSYDASTATSGNTSNHSYASKVTKEATCASEGTKTYTCSVCGSSYTEKISETSDHTLTRIAAVSAGDSHSNTEGNIEYYKCSVCGKCFEDSTGKVEIDENDTVLFPEGHHVTHVKAKDATCTKEGNKEYWYCSDCDLYYSDVELTNIVQLSDMKTAATGHTLSLVPEKAATCTKDGNIAYYSCSVCGANFSDDHGENSLDNVTISATGHSTVHEEAKNPTTTVTGNMEYWYCAACDTYFLDESCTEEVTEESTVLPIVENPIDLTVIITWEDHDGDPIPESWIADPLTIELSATSQDGHVYEFVPVKFTSESGWTYTFKDIYDDMHYAIIDREGDYIFHSNYDDSTHTLYVTGVLEADIFFEWNEDYTECEAIFTDTNGNILDIVTCSIASAVSEEPTCVEDGLMIYTAVADYFGSAVSIDALDEEGVAHQSGTSYVTDTEMVAIPATGHTPGEHVAEVLPTAEKNGNVEYWICSVCGIFLDQDGNVIDDVTTAMDDTSDLEEESNSERSESDDSDNQSGDELEPNETNSSSEQESDDELKSDKTDNEDTSEEEDSNETSRDNGNSTFSFSSTASASNASDVSSNQPDDEGSEDDSEDMSSSEDSDENTNEEDNSSGNENDEEDSDVSLAGASHTGVVDHLPLYFGIILCSCFILVILRKRYPRDSK